MATTAERLMSKVVVDHLPTQTTVTITEEKHGLRTASGVPVAPTQVIVESGAEWSIQGTSVILKNRTPRSLTDLQVWLVYQFSDTESPEKVSGASPISDLVGVQGALMVPFDISYMNPESWNHQPPLKTKELLTNLPDAAFKAVRDGVTLAQGVWEIEWFGKLYGRSFGWPMGVTFSAGLFIGGEPAYVPGQKLGDRHWLRFYNILDLKEANEKERTIAPNVVTGSDFSGFNDAKVGACGKIVFKKWV